MNTLLLWLPVASWFLGGLAVASVLGFVSYLFVRRLKDALPETLMVLEVVLGCGISYLILVALPRSLITAAIVGLVCGGGTLAERATASTSQNLGAVLMRMLFATVCSFVFCIALVSVGGLWPTGGSTGPAFRWGSSLGALCSPSVIPFFVWMWQGIQMRPGLDRPLDAEELKTQG